MAIFRCATKFLWIAMLSLLSGTIFAAEADPKAELSQPLPFTPADESSTEHTVTINGQQVSYRAIAGLLPLKDDKGKAKGSIFYISYARTDIPESSRADRPIAFCFNGGPGSSSVWLHMGILGPKRVVLRDEEVNLAPYSYIDNEFSLLDEVDLVFIDPISTGYSRAAADEDPKQFHGYDEDIKSVAEFIRLYITKYERWASPKFLLGESYGSLRAAAMASYLHEQFIYLNGVILVSSVLDFQTIDRNESNDLANLLYLPSYTAAAWYHHKLPAELQGDLQVALETAKAFTVDEYASALMKGDRLPSEQKKALAKKLAALTGLSESYILQSNLRVSIYRFVKELLRDQNRSIGRFDARFTGIENDRCGLYFEQDPSAEAIFGAFAGSFNQYVRQDLKWQRDDHYEILADVQPWDYGKARNSYLSVTPNLKTAMQKNPKLQVLVCNGYFDLATPFFTSDYTFNHMNLDPSIADNITMTYYHAGHMMYVHFPSLVEMSSDLKNFVQKSLALSAKGDGQHSGQ